MTSTTEYNPGMCKIAGGPRSASAKARSLNDRPPLQLARILLLRLISRIAGWFLLLEVFPTTLSLTQKTHQIREILLGQRVLVGGHVGTAVFDLRYHSLIVDRLSRYQSGAFVEISQRRGSCSGCPRIVVVADQTFIEVNFFF